MFLIKTIKLHYQAVIKYLAYDLSIGEEIVNPQSEDHRLLRGVDNSFHLVVGEIQKLFLLTPHLAEDLISQLDSQLEIAE